MLKINLNQNWNNDKCQCECKNKKRHDYMFGILLQVIVKMANI